MEWALALTYANIIQKCADGLKKNIVFFWKWVTQTEMVQSIIFHIKSQYINYNNFNFRRTPTRLYIGLRYDCIPIMWLYIPHFYWLDQKHIYSTILLKTVIYTSIYHFLHLHHGCCYTPRVDEIMNISNEAKVPLVAGRKRSIRCIWLPN